MNKYKVSIYWSDEDQAFVAEVPDLPGCSAHGDSQEAALANAQEAIRLWIDAPMNLAIQFPSRKADGSSSLKAITPVSISYCSADADTSR